MRFRRLRILPWVQELLYYRVWQLVRQSLKDTPQAGLLTNSDSKNVAEMIFKLEPQEVLQLLPWPFWNTVNMWTKSALPHWGWDTLRRERPSKPSCSSQTRHMKPMRLSGTSPLPADLPTDCRHGNKPSQHHVGHLRGALPKLPAHRFIHKYIGGFKLLKPRVVCYATTED